MSLKVTVVVPTYNSGDVVRPLIDAMKRQTLPAEDFEVLFVDDGSTDGTPDRLEELAARDPLFRVIRLENSGWPGRPRNVAIEQARGEYVQFVDHDDSMGPEALERMYAIGARNGSDYVIGKVTITHRLRGAPQALMSRTRESVTWRTAPLHDSLTVHKMYRTQFLREQGIRFPVGHYVGEDLLFMVPAVLRARSVSIVGDYPCYFYLEREEGGHATPDLLDPASYARNLREILDALLAETEPGPARDTWLRRFWRADMVKYLSEPIFPAYPDDAYRDRLLQALREVAAQYLTEGVYAGLLGLERPRAALVRAGRTAEVAELAARAARMGARAELTGAYWHRERLRLSFDASFTYGGEPLALERDGGRYLLPAALTEGLGVERVDVSEELARFRVDVLLHNRETAVKWMLPRDLDVVWEEQPGGGVAPVVRGTVAVDPRRAAGGQPLPAGEWDLQVRVLGPGLDRTTDLAAPGSAPAVPAGAAAGTRVSQAAGDGVLVLATQTGVEPSPDAAAPKVSVVLPAGEDAELLAASLASLAGQSWPAERFETVLVADAVQAVPDPLPAGVRVVRHEGGGDRRDTGAAAARGDYLYFLRPGDRLGPEALERLYGYGLEHDADVVAGRLAGAKGRPVPKELYARDRPAASLAKDPLGDSLTADKLVDRAMAQRHGLRFGPDGRPLREQEYTVRALLHARRTAVLGSYVYCSYAPLAKAEPVPPGPFYARLRELAAVADGLTGPGPARDRLHRRWLRVEVLDRIGGTRLAEMAEADREELLGQIRETLPHLSPTAAAGLPARQRLALALLAEGRTADLLALSGWERTVACLPLLRSVEWRDDGTLAVAFTARPAADGRPLELLAGQDRLSPTGLPPELRGRLAAEALTGPAEPARATAVLVLRERATGAQYPLPTACEAVREPVPADGGAEALDTLAVTGTAVLDPGAVAPGTVLGDGAWDFHVRLTALGWTASARLGAGRLPEVTDALSWRPHPDGSDRRVTPYWTTPGSDLSLRVGRPKPPQPRQPAPPRARNPLARALRRMRGSA